MRNMTPQQLGLFGEKLAKRKLENFGLDVLHVATLDLGYDLLVNDTLKVEVKTARLNSRSKFQFCLTKKDHANIRKSDVVILQCVFPDGCIKVFVVPTNIVENNSQITIGGNLENYKGLVSQYRV